MNDKELCQWLRDNSSGTYRPSAEAADRIESQNRELAELKASIPQIQHSAIVKAAEAFFRTEEYTHPVRMEVVGYMRGYATINSLTQAKEQSE